MSQTNAEISVNTNPLVNVIDIRINKRVPGDDTEWGIAEGMGKVVPEWYYSYL